MTMSKAQVSPSRPASSGGGVPAPGAYGLAIGSIDVTIASSTALYD